MHNNTIMYAYPASGGKNSQSTRNNTLLEYSSTSNPLRRITIHLSQASSNVSSFYKYLSTLGLYPSYIKENTLMCSRIDDYTVKYTPYKRGVPDKIPKSFFIYHHMGHIKYKSRER